MNCEKCGDKGGYEWAEKLRLIGGYNTRLCTKCENAWHLYITESPLWKEMTELKYRGEDIIVAAHGQAEPTEALAPIRARLADISRQMFDVGKAWIASRSESPQAVAAVDPHVGTSEG